MTTREETLAEVAKLIEGRGIKLELDVIEGADVRVVLRDRSSPAGASPIYEASVPWGDVGFFIPTALGMLIPER
ncbi:MAG TPA: hypothetical protein VIY27_06010 [Myxococcota bacterium]